MPLHKKQLELLKDFPMPLPLPKKRMARIKLELPSEFLFQLELRIRVYDLNYGAHLANDRVLALFHEARVQFLQFLGISNEKDGMDGVGIIMTDAAVVYKAESFLGDLLTIKVAVADMTTKSMDLIYLIENSATGKEVARGKTGILCFDYNCRRIAAFPDKYLKIIEDLLGK
jgi:acyl-CoA thioester hydrolase